MDETLTVRRDEILGRGVFGAAVYRGTFNGVEVAVKSIPRAHFIDEEDIRLQESNILSLNHDSVIRIHHVEENDQYR